MKTDLNNTVLKSLVTTLQSKVDYLEAENNELERMKTRFILPAPNNESGPSLAETTDLLWKVQDARAELGALSKKLQGQVDTLEAENKLLRKGLLPAADNTKFSEIAFSLKHSNDHLFKERDKLAEENEKLFKDNTKLANKIKTIESGNLFLTYNDHDKLIEENKKLLKDNTKLATRVRKIESGNFDEYFTYTTMPVPLSPGGTVVTTISLSREADFYVTKIVRESSKGPFAFLVRDSSNDRQWSNLPLHSDIGAGTAQLPLILPMPRFVPRASVITIQLTDLSTRPGDNVVRLAFIGYKIYHIENLKDD